MPNRRCRQVPNNIVMSEESMFFLTAQGESPSATSGDLAGMGARTVRSGAAAVPTSRAILVAAEEVPVLTATQMAGLPAHAASPAATALAALG